MYEIIYCASGSKDSMGKENYSSILRAKFRYEAITLGDEKNIKDKMDLRINGKTLMNYLREKLSVEYTGSHDPYRFKGNNKIVEISYPWFFGFGFNLKIITNKFENLEEVIDLWELDKIIELDFEPINS